VVVMGVDPGLARTGYGCLRYESDRCSAVAYGCLYTPAGVPVPERLLRLYRGITELLESHRPDVLAVETILFGRNSRTAFKVGQARGVVMLAAAEAGVPVREFNPLTVKHAVAGYGGATKEQVQRMVQLLLSLSEPPRPDDAADALAVAWCCAEASSWEKVVTT